MLQEFALFGVLKVLITCSQTYTCLLVFGFDEIQNKCRIIFHHSPYPYAQKIDAPNKKNKSPPQGFRRKRRSITFLTVSRQKNATFAI